MTKRRGAYRTTEEAREQLRAILRPGQTVYTILRHVSASGMYRAIGLHAITADRRAPDGVRRDWLSRYAYEAGAGDRWDDRRDAVGVTGAGMDMGFALVYELGCYLWPDGFRCTGKRCPGNVHSNPPYPPRDGRRKHRDGGGYALRHEWLG